MGEEERFSGLEAAFVVNRQQLLRFLRARGAGENAEDLLQELWLKAVMQPSGPISHPLAYLYRMANNLMLDRRRGEARARQREHDWADLNTATLTETGERKLLAQEQLQQVATALDGLGDRTSTIFRRFRLDGATQQQIAAELGISLSAVEKHLQKAYRALLEVRKRDDAG